DITTLRPDQSPTEATLDVRLDFSSGLMASLWGCRDVSFSIFEMDIIGTLGRARIIDSGHSIEYYKMQPNERYAGFSSLVLDAREDGGLDGAMLNAVDNLYDSLVRSTAPKCTAQDGFEALRL